MFSFVLSCDLLVCFLLRNLLSVASSHNCHIQEKKERQARIEMSKVENVFAHLILMKIGLQIEHTIYLSCNRLWPIAGRPR